MNLGAEQEAFSHDLVTLMQKAWQLGYEIRIGEVERTIEQQKLYIQSGRSTAMDSMHLKKCAADLHFTLGGELCYPQELGSFWESLNPKNRWGGNWKSFKDKPHFQRTV